MPAPVYATYARHSDRHQAGSVEQQIEVFQSYAAAHGHDVPPQFTFADRGKSGTTDAGRDGLLALMTLLERKPRPVAGLYVYDSSRLGRNEADAAFYRATIRKLGYELIYVGDDGLNNSGEVKHIMEAVKGYQDAQFSRQLGRNVKRGMAAALRAGGAAGQAPMGYMSERVENGHGKTISRLVPDPDKWDLCLAAWKLRVSGASLVDVHRATKLFKTHQSYANMFANSLYKGVLHYDGVDYADFCPPMVTAATWAAAQRVSGERYHPRAMASGYLLTGLVVCPQCGGRMRGSQSEKAGTRYRYYRCTAATIYKQHPSVGIRVEPLEQAVLDELFAHYFTPAVLGPLAEQVLSERRDSAGRHHGTADSLRKQLAGVDAAIAHLLQVVEGGGFASVSARLAEREQERGELAARLSAASEQVSLVAVPDVDVAAVCERARAIIAGGTVAEKKRLIRSCVEAVYPRQPELHIAFRVPLG